MWKKIVRRWKEWGTTWKIFTTIMIVLVGSFLTWASTFTTDTTIEGWLTATELYLESSACRIYKSGNDMYFDDVTGGPYTLAQLVTDTTYTGGIGITFDGTTINSDVATDTQVGHITVAAQTLAGKKTLNDGIAVPEGEKIWIAANSYFIAGNAEAAVYLYVNNNHIVTWN